MVYGTKSFSESGLFGRLEVVEPIVDQSIVNIFKLVVSETCGAGWEQAVTRHALAALGAGGGVVVAGRLSARVCDALAAAAATLRRPQPAPCAEHRARGAAVAHLARRLRWRRAHLPPSDGECGAALRAVERALLAAGVAPPDAPHMPHAVVACDSTPDATPGPGGDAATDITDVILLRVSGLDDARIAGVNRTLLSDLVTEYFESAGNYDDALKDRFFILSDEFSEIVSGAHSVYDDILEATLLHEESLQTGVEVFHNSFILYTSTSTDGSRKWTSTARVAVTAQQPVGAPAAWAAKLTIDAAGALELRRRAERRKDNAQKGQGGGEDLLLMRMGALLLCAMCAMCALFAFMAVCLRRFATWAGYQRVHASPVLAADDFQFPADERRVGEGMETMLSWLQQLTDSNEPEPTIPERLDLPRRPEPRPPVPSAPSSTCSVTRLAPDRRIRYKGDPVHVKYLPAAALDLRRETVDLLLVMQSLRHENLNPFVGCLTTLRPALVWETCSRGSLEDVLVADDISLDWTFRLSLLTDLVSGMRYLHQSPVRLHARLSSRNCVVDARWVLRVTDYGLPGLAAAQALPYAPRGARELLWTAPELLRAPSVAAVPGGTQAGDVFSFGIIMQEVIVRGEPYCMLALSPEEIIEKLRHPPPLVRPSVSLGAAPPDAVAVMRQCWSEQPEHRPDFTRLQEQFRRMHRGRWAPSGPSQWQAHPI